MDDDEIGSARMSREIQTSEADGEKQGETRLGAASEIHTLTYSYNTENLYIFLFNARIFRIILTATAFT